MTTVKRQHRLATISPSYNIVQLPYRPTTCPTSSCTRRTNLIEWFNESKLDIVLSVRTQPNLRVIILSAFAIFAFIRWFTNSRKKIMQCKHRLLNTVYWTLSAYHRLLGTVCWTSRDQLERCGPDKPLAWLWSMCAPVSIYLRATPWTESNVKSLSDWPPGVDCWSVDCSKKLSGRSELHLTDQWAPLVNWDG